jgi:hypothetical protein
LLPEQLAAECGTFHPLENVHLYRIR